VHVEVAFEPMLGGAQATEVSVVAPGTMSVTTAVGVVAPGVVDDGLEVPSEAETVAVGELPAVRVPVVAENVVLLCPECIATLAGTLRAVLLLCKRTEV
jgi:hypothetical protein